MCGVDPVSGQASSNIANRSYCFGNPTHVRVHLKVFRLALSQKYLRQKENAREFYLGTQKPCFTGWFSQTTVPRHYSQESTFNSYTYMRSALKLAL